MSLPFEYTLRGERLNELVGDRKAQGIEDRDRQLEDYLATSTSTGSNSNGEYTQFPDGTMVCWHSWSAAVAITTVYGSLFTGTTVWTFPVAFVTTVAPPVVTVGEAQWGTNSSWGISQAGSLGTSNTIRVIDVSSRASTTDTTFKVSAIGRWK